MTTILVVRKGSHVVMGGDGQVSMGNSVLKASAKKVRRLHGGKVIAGFAGSTADALTLFDLFEKKLELYPGQLQRAAVALAKDWRSDKALRHLDAMLLVADKELSLIITGIGDVIEPEEGVMAIGSGGGYARSAALALVRQTKLSAEAIVKAGLAIASELCVYTNKDFVFEKIKVDNDS